MKSHPARACDDAESKQHFKHGKWRTVAGVLTNSNGDYRAGGLGASGKYRTVAKETTLSSGDLCLRDISLIAKK